jgi:hypothetical protein
MNATCIECKRTFETERTDSAFCTDECKASYYRKFGATGKHVPLPKTASKMCEHCGNLFWYNEYANRGGKREPTFCKDACRVAAWREKQKAAKEAHENAQRNSRSWDAFREREQATRQQRTQSNSSTSNDYRDRLVIPRRWNEIDALTWILGKDVDRHYSEAEIRKIWRDCNMKSHPDQNGGAVYKHLSTINAAFDFMKRIIWRKN